MTNCATEAAAQGLGLEVDELGRLAFAAEQSGLRQEKFINAISRLNQAMGEAVIEARKAGSETKKLGNLTDFAREASEKFGVTVRDMTAELGGAAKGLAKTEETGTLAARALARLGITVLDAKGNVRPLGEVLLEVADAFKAMPDGVEKSAIAIDIFGNRIARLIIPLLNQGAAGIRALGEEAEGLDLIFTKEQALRGVELIDAFNRFKTAAVGGGVFKGLSQEIGLIFSEDATRAVDNLTAALRRNRDAIVAFAEGEIKTAISLVKDLVAAIQGRDADVKEPFILKARDAIVAFAKDVKAAFDNVILPAFRALVAAADFVAGAINAVFGTKFTGRQLLIAAVVAQLVGAFAVLGAGVGVVISALGLLGTAFLSLGLLPALIVAGLAAAAVLFVVFWDDIKDGAQAVWNFLKSGFGGLVGVITDFGSAMADGLVSAFRGAVATIKSLLSSLISLARRAFKAAKQAAGFSGGGSATVPVLAGGGRVRGPGTATSDSIPVRLSRGEFVIRAAAVERYGAELFATLNALRLPKGALSGFSLGGLVQGLDRTLASIMPVPAFAAGGLAPALAAAPAGGRPITLVLDGQRFPMRADQEVAEALGRVALGQARSSAGRPPRRL